MRRGKSCQIQRNLRVTRKKTLFCGHKVFQGSNNLHLFDLVTRMITFTKKNRCFISRCLTLFVIPAEGPNPERLPRTQYNLTLPVLLNKERNEKLINPTTLIFNLIKKMNSPRQVKNLKG